MKSYKVSVFNQEEFTVDSNVQIYEGDCIVFKEEYFYVHNREGNTLYVKQVNKTVTVY